VDKPRGKTSFSLISALRRRLNVKKIGHAGTLDPFATGLMVLLVGRDYTRLSDRFIGADKEYVARLKLGEATDSYDCDGSVTQRSDQLVTQDEFEAALAHFQGEVEQVPPMFSAKKVKGQKLYNLARKGIEIERQPVKVQMETSLIHFGFPYVDIRVSCSKGTYVRSIAHDLGQRLGCGAHLVELQRLRCGSFHLGDSVDGSKLTDPELDVEGQLMRTGPAGPGAFG
jgi:tRNA pseudouridine55 synthase